GSGQAQHRWQFRHFTVADGLVQNSVNAIFQDSAGYLWIGTNSGLCRFDGYSFKPYVHNRADANSLSGDFVLSIAEDRHRTLWIATAHGLNRLDKDRQQFAYHYIDTLDTYSFHNKFNQVMRTSWDNICAVDHRGGYFLGDRAFEGPQRQQLGAPDIRQLEDSVLRFFTDRNRQLHLINAFGHYTVRSGQSVVLQDTLQLKQAIHEDLTIQAAYADTRGYLWLGTSHGLWRYHRQQGLVSLGAGLHASAFLEDRQGNFWVGTYQGLHMFPRGNWDAPPVVITARPLEKGALMADVITALFEDRSGIIWIGTANAGLQSLDPMTFRFKGIAHREDGVATGISHPLPWGLLEDDEGNLWVGHEQGVDLIRPKPGAASWSGHFEAAQRIAAIESPSVAPVALDNEAVIAMLRDRNNRLWLGTNRGTMLRKDLNTGITTPFSLPFAAVGNGVVYDLLEDRQGTVWVASGSGLFSLDPETWDVQAYLPDTTDPNAIRTTYILCAYEDRTGNFWFGGNSGVGHLDRSTGKVTHYQHAADDSTSLSYNMVSAFHEDRQGRFWVGTLGGGLNRMDREAGTFDNFGRQDGWADDVIYGILEDDHGGLWMSSNNGIIFFHPDQGIVERYGLEDGLISNEFSQNGYLQNARGELLFSAMGGVVIFHPDSVRENRDRLPVVLTGLDLNYEPQRWQDYRDPEADANGLLFSPREKVVAFNFATLDFRHSGKVRYAYRLAGFHEKWVEVDGDHRTASFSNLDPGTYRFQVKATNGRGAWDPPSLEVPLRVLPPYWQTWWFIALGTLAVLSLVASVMWYLSRRKLKKRLQKLEMQQRIQEERERISRDLHDNVGAHLTYIISNLDHISYQSQRKGYSPDRLDKLGDYARSTMRQLRETIWAIHKESLTMPEFTEKIRSFLNDQQLAQDALTFRVIPGEDPGARLKPHQALHVYRVVQESVNNALKHARATCLEVHVSISVTEVLRVQVRDNGVGMCVDSAKDLEGHHGLKNMQYRVEELGGRFILRSEPGKGTTLEMLVPLR
ncbi:MAG: two-component regulator propeller domain-containing protein, partial [Bacteroidota bacterium]